MFLNCKKENINLVSSSDTKRQLSAFIRLTRPLKCDVMSKFQHFSVVASMFADNFTVYDFKHTPADYKLTKIQNNFIIIRLIGQTLTLLKCDNGNNFRNDIPYNINRLTFNRFSYYTHVIINCEKRMKL
jgi:hypothetical protein